MLSSIAAGVISGTASFAQNANPANPLAAQIDQLTAAIKNDTAKNLQKDDARTALNALLTEIATVPCDATDAGNIACKVVQLSSFAAKLSALNQNKQLTKAQEDQLWDAVKFVLTGTVKDQDTPFIDGLDLLTNLQNVEGFTLHDPKTALDKLDTFIAATASHIHPPTAAADKKSVADTAVKFTQDSAKLVAAVTGPVKQWNRVDGAWFGHLGDIRSALKSQGSALSPWAQNTRFCSATRAIRARCEAQEECFEPISSSSTGGSSGNTAEVTGVNLCGYEPAPFADQSSRGLVIRYRCLSSASPDWDTFASDDDLVPPAPPQPPKPPQPPHTSRTSRTSRASHTVQPPPPSPPTITPGTRDAQLRTGIIADIRCPPPAAPTANNGTGGNNNNNNAGGNNAPLAVSVPSSINVTIEAPKAAPTPTPTPNSAYPGACPYPNSRAHPHS